MSIQNSFPALLPGRPRTPSSADPGKRVRRADPRLRPVAAAIPTGEADLALASAHALLHAAGLVVVFALALLLAEHCVDPAWVLPSALALTCGFLLIGLGLLLAGRQVRRLLRGCAALAWRCLSWDNVNCAVFVGGVLLGLWNLGASVPGRWW